MHQKLQRKGYNPNFESKGDPTVLEHEGKKKGLKGTHHFFTRSKRGRGGITSGMKKKERSRKHSVCH